ncbi:hypothetical protein ID866_13268 [Astraeus odoratus]|nr:hypothetical protein ID866_13268 [Astraeus odoratus]
MHDPHTDPFLMPDGMTQLGLSLMHLMPTGMLIWLLLTCTSESACCFLASATVIMAH